MAGTIVQITTVFSWGSIARIAKSVASLAEKEGWTTYFAYGRGDRPEGNSIKIGGKLDVVMHGLKTRLTDRHGFGSKRATRKLVRRLREIQPDIIHIHNLHGYYLNIKILLEYLAQARIPVVLTMHDCWTFTGHCVWFEYIGCNEWTRSCEGCVARNTYPKSMACRASQNLEDKKKLFAPIEDLTIVPVCNWLANLVRDSHLGNRNIQVIYNGIDLKAFFPRPEDKNLAERLGTANHFVALAVASVWTPEKGLNSLIELYDRFDSSMKLVMVGLTKSQIKRLPKGIIGLERTGNVEELAALYSMADVFVNPTTHDTLPTVNIEAIACGTPVVTYDTAGCGDIVNSDTGFVIEVGNLDKMLSAIHEIKQKGKAFYTANCRSRATTLFDQDKKFTEYVSLYEKLLNNR